jgi:hypothetical protein
MNLKSSDHSSDRVSRPMLHAPRFLSFLSSFLSSFLFPLYKILMPVPQILIKPL